MDPRQACPCDGRPILEEVEGARRSLVRLETYRGVMSERLQRAFHGRIRSESHEERIALGSIKKLER